MPTRSRPASTVGRPPGSPASRSSGTSTTASPRITCQPRPSGWSERSLAASPRPSSPIRPPPWPRSPESAERSPRARWRSTAPQSGNVDGPGPLRIGMLGRLASWKGQHVFLEAFASAFPEGTEQAVIIGSALFAARRRLWSSPPTAGGTAWHRRSRHFLRVSRGRGRGALAAGHTGARLGGPRALRTGRRGGHGRRSPRDRHRPRRPRRDHRGRGGWPAGSPERYRRPGACAPSAGRSSGASANARSGSKASGTRLHAGRGRGHGPEYLPACGQGSPGSGAWKAARRADSRRDGTG